MNDVHIGSFRLTAAIALLTAIPYLGPGTALAVAPPRPSLPDDDGGSGNPVVVATGSVDLVVTQLSPYEPPEPPPVPRCTFESGPLGGNPGCLAQDIKLGDKCAVLNFTTKSQWRKRWSFSGKTYWTMTSVDLSLTREFQLRKRMMVINIMAFEMVDHQSSHATYIPRTMNKTFDPGVTSYTTPDPPGFEWETDVSAYPVGTPWGLYSRGFRANQGAEFPPHTYIILSDGSTCSQNRDYAYEWRGGIIHVP